MLEQSPWAWLHLVFRRLPLDWRGMLKLALDIQEIDKQYKISFDVPGVEEKDI